MPEYCRPVEAAQGERDGARRLTMEKYLSMLLKAQESELVAAPEEADLILTMEKSAEGKGVSLVDRNFYLDKRGITQNIYVYSDVTHTMFRISYIKYCQYNHSCAARRSKACKAASKTAKRGAQL